MKNYIIGLLSVIILLSGSFIYKQNNIMICQHFPVPESLMRKSPGVPFYLFLFFSKKNCTPCILEIIEVLNSLPPQFCIAGIIPKEELKEEPGFRKLTGMSFPLFSYHRFKKYLPGYRPTLFGVSPAGKITFVIAGTGEQKLYLRSLIISTYKKLYLSFDKEHSEIMEEKGGEQQ